MKKFIAVFLALTIVLTMSACHGQGVRKAETEASSNTSAESISAAESSPTETDTEQTTGAAADNAQEGIGVMDPDKQYTITFWSKNDTNKSQVAIYKQAIEDFEALYPNIHVEIQFYTDYAKIYNDVITNIATNTTPNVCITYPDHIATYLSGNDIVVPLDAYFEDPTYGFGGTEVRFDSPSEDEIVPEFLEECVIEGVHYAIPYMRSTEACYINKDYVEALGYEVPDILTWDFVWEVSEAAMAKNEDGTFAVNGQNVMIPFIYKSTDNMMIQMLRQLGADYSTDKGEILLFNDTTEDLLYTIAEHAQTRAFSTFKISSYPANYLNAGQCIFAVDSTAGSTWMGSDAPLLDISEDQLVKFETVVRTIPQYDPSNPQMISQGPSICIFNKSDQGEVIASWLFAQYLLSNDVQTAYAETEGYVPVTLKAQESDEYQEYLSGIGEDNTTHYDVKILASELLLDNIENTFVTPVFNGSANLRDAAGQLIEEVTKSVRRKEVIDDTYMETLFDKMISMKKLDQNGLVIGYASYGPLEDSDPAAGQDDSTVSQNSAEASAVTPVKQSSVSNSKDLGPLPTASVALLSGLGIVWLLIAAYYIKTRLKRK